MKSSVRVNYIKEEIIWVLFIILIELHVKYFLIFNVFKSFFSDFSLIHFKIED